MKPYSVHLSQRAKKQLYRLDAKVQKRVVNALKTLNTQPQAGKPLRGELKDYRSLRVGDWRILYTIRHKEIEIMVVYLGHRREVYSRVS